jgi:hypothetical protein
VVELIVTLQQRGIYMDLLRSSLSGFLIFGLLTGSVVGWGQDKAAVVPDAQIEANVLKALASAPQLADQAISTTTVYGQVTLSGTVRDEASRDLAEKVAADAPGVQKVIDQLAIGSAMAESTPAQEQNSAAEGAGPVLQSDGTYAPTRRESNPPDEDENNHASAAPPSAGPPPPPYQRSYSPSNRQPPQAQPYGRPYGGQQGGESVVVPSGSMIRVRVNQGMDSRHTAPGTLFDGIVLNDVVADNEVAIPRGTAVQGRVVDARNAGALKGRGQLALQLTQITLGGQTYPVISHAWTHEGADKTSQTVGNAVGLGAVGAMIGAVAGGGSGALLGAGVGGAAGLGTSAASRRGEATVPSEAILTFHLAQALPLTTVSQAEMNRLASGIQIGSQQMQRRYPPPPPPPYYYGPTYYPRY